MNLRPPKYASDHIAEIGYDEDSGTLVVKFQRGGAYTYEGVPLDTYERLLSAPSAGGFFHEAIKGKYRHRRLNG